MVRLFIRDLRGEAWRATELIKKVRAIQPHIIIDNRQDASSEGNLAFISTNPEIYSGDFACLEMIIPSQGFITEGRQSVPWETCLTLNNHWGYCASDLDYKSLEQIVRALVECVSKNGNLLLNVGPNAKGEIPIESERILAQVGTWIRRNGESIYGCGRASFSKPERGRYIQKGNVLYAHIFERGVGSINFRGLNGKIKQARLLADDSEIKVGTFWQPTDYPEGAFMNFPGARLPDEIDTGVTLELE